MKVKMLEHYQDAQVHYLPDEEVDTSAALGAWLVEHRKAVKLEVAAAGVHYGGQEDAELKPRDDEKLYEQMKEGSAETTQEEAAEPETSEDFEPSVDRKTKRGKGKK